MAVDLHLHSTASDGTMEPAAIVSRASELGLTTIALTDHDTFSGIPEAYEESVNHALRLIPGVELSAVQDGRDFHVVSYFLDTHNSELNEKLEKLRRSRHERAVRIVDKLVALGANINYAQVEQTAKGEAVGRPHIAQVLVQNGAATDTGDAFEKYLGRGRPAFEAKYVLEIEEIFRLVHQAGGVASLAHPALAGVDESILARFQAQGLDGIEVWHADHTEDQTRYLQKIAEKLGFLMTGGSDCHGSAKRRGFVLGTLLVPDEIIEPLEERANQIKSEL